MWLRQYYNHHTSPDTHRGKTWMRNNAMLSNDWVEQQSISTWGAPVCTLAASEHSAQGSVGLEHGTRSTWKCKILRWGLGSVNGGVENMECRELGVTEKQQILGHYGVFQLNVNPMF